MEIPVVLLVLVLASLAAAQHNLTTLDDLFLDDYGLTLREFSPGVLADFRTVYQRPVNLGNDSLPGSRNQLPLAEELLEYKRTLEDKMALAFATSLENVTARYLHSDCSGREASTETCIITALRSRLRTAVEVTLQELWLDCARKRVALCSTLNDRYCISVYERRLRHLLVYFVEDATADHEAPAGSTLPVIVRSLMIKVIVRMSQILQSADTFLTLMANITGSVSSLDPFTFENLIQPWNNEAMKSVMVNQQDDTTQSRDDLSWGIIRSNTGTVDLPCSYFRDDYTQTAKRFTSLVYRCYYQSLLQAHSQLLLCAYRDPASTPMTLKVESPALYFSSRCLCLASNGDDCGVEAGVDPDLHCLSVLLRDFQTRVWFRPAVTYLDYAFQTRVPVCQFADLLRVGFKRLCNEFHVFPNLDWILSSRCYYEGLVNKDLNCSERLSPSALNRSALCSAKFFMHHVLCEEDNKAELRVLYYGVGDSPLVQIVTYLDVAMRFLTLVTYLACPQLRNLPGKLLIGYLLTALLRLVVVRATLLESFSLAVRLDIVADLSSTLWLSSYLHFLTICIKTLRLPDSLSPSEARLVLIRYALLGWALPAALSVAFFTMDVFLVSRVQVGQLLFVLCNYAALSANLYMFHHNFSFYYDVRRSAMELRPEATARSVFSDLFNFAVKTSLLSGAGITIRLVLTQIQGLEQLLGLYHVLGSLQGLLVFLLYGCNRKARAFWISAVSSALRRRATSS